MDAFCLKPCDEYRIGFGRLQAGGVLLEYEHHSPDIMDTLITIFGSHVKVKILRLFLFNETVPFLPSEIVSRSKSSVAR